MADVHGNLQALEAVLADGAAEGVDAWWALGDLVAVGPDPVPCLDRLTGLPDVAFVSGNSERYVVAGDRPPPTFDDVVAGRAELAHFVEVEAAFSWTRGALAAHDRLDWLATLPAEVRTTLPDGTRVLGVHASPQGDDGPGITPHRPEAELHADLAGAGADLVLAGHTHQPTDRWVSGIHAVNGGSVSNPITDDLRAGYVIVHADRHGHRVEHRRVAYDHEAFVARVERSSFPGAAFVTRFQRGGHVQYPSVRAGAPTAR